MIADSAVKLEFVEAPESRDAATLAQAVLDGLSRTPKTLPCRFFYDTVGSDLFERICRLPEYYLTRSEQSILERYALEMIESAGPEIALVEFGSGSSCKTRILMDAALARQPRLHYIPIDISADFLRASCHTLLQEYDGVWITAVAAEYGHGIELLPPEREPRLFLFLGSNIGNFDSDEAVAFLRRIRRRMRPEDRLLVGYDLLKERSILEAAYDDAEGVTAAFNRNLLARINHELDADFDPDGFEHRAPFVEEHSRIEMRLVSRVRQSVSVRAVGRSFTFQPGEYIHTENSHKYTHQAFDAICGRSALRACREWRDDREWFAVALLEPAHE